MKEISDLNKDVIAVGLEVNEHKKKEMMVEEREKRIKDHPNIVVFEKYQCVLSFKYLASMVNNTPDEAEEVRRRISAGNRASLSLSPFVALQSYLDPGLPQFLPTVVSLLCCCFPTLYSQCLTSIFCDVICLLLPWPFSTPFTLHPSIIYSFRNSIFTHPL